MQVAIIGAGFTGLSAGYFLSKAGVDVTIIEASGSPGGLAGGFKGKNWNWSLEQYYHHLFTSDNHILDLVLPHYLLFQLYIHLDIIYLEQYL